MDQLRGVEWWSNGAVQACVRFLLSAVAAIAIVYRARFVADGLARVSERISHSPAIGNLVGKLARVVAFFVALYVFLKIIGLDDAALSVLAGAGVAGIVIGFALQDIAANFLAGIILAIQRPFRVGHLVEISDVYGVVKKIHMRSNEVQKLDGQLAHIPNKTVLLGVVSDYNYIPFRRVDLTIGVTYGEDLQTVQTVAIDAIRQLDCCDVERPVEVFFTDFGDSSINFSLRFWTAYQHETDFLLARSEAIKAIQQAFAREHIEIPFPITTVYDGQYQ